MHEMPYRDVTCGNWIRLHDFILYWLAATSIKIYLKREEKSLHPLYASGLMKLLIGHLTLDRNIGNRPLQQSP